MTHLRVSRVAVRPFEHTLSALKTTTMRTRFLLSLLSVISSVTSAFQGVAKVSTIRETLLFALSHQSPSDDRGVSRRQVTSFLATTAAATTLGWFGSSANAEMMQLPAESTELAPGLLASRVVSNVISPPPYGMEGPDIFYPS